jgi:hypothetical protein
LYTPPFAISAQAILAMRLRSTSVNVAAFAERSCA